MQRIDIYATTTRPHGRHTCHRIICSNHCRDLTDLSFRLELCYFIKQRLLRKFRNFIILRITDVFCITCFTIHHPRIQLVLRSHIRSTRLYSIQLSPASMRCGDNPTAFSIAATCRITS